MVELISVHVPKTAGTAFRHVLTDVYGIESVLGDYPPDSICKPDKVPPNTKVIHGHFAPSKYENYFAEAKRIVWLRHPIFRLISEYFFAKTIKDRNNVLHAKLLENDLSILEFAEIPGMRNFLTRTLEEMSLDKFDFVGIQEFYQQDLVQLQTMMGWSNFQSVVKNTNRYPQYQKCLESVLGDNGLIDRLAKINHKDMKLYNQALQKRAKRSSQAPSIQSTLADWQRSQFLIQQSQEIVDKAQLELQQTRYWLKKSKSIPIERQLILNDKKETGNELIGFHIESPQSPIKNDNDLILVRGWAIGKNSMATQLIISCDKDLINKTDINLSRPDVAQVYDLQGAKNSGFETFITISGMPNTSKLILTVVLENRTKIEIATIK